MGQVLFPSEPPVEVAVLMTSPTSLQIHPDAMLKAPVFVVCPERSGSTMLRLMLAHHPKLAWLNEFEYAVDLVGDDGTLPRMDEYHLHLSVNRMFQASGFALDRSLPYKQLVNSFLVQRADAHGHPIIGANVHRHYNRLLHIWPDARFIHLVRDGRDVARSCVEMGMEGTVWGGARRWCEGQALWAAMVKDLADERWIQVRYEDLVREPVMQLTRLCEFIGVPYDDAIFDYAKTTTYDTPDPQFLAQWKRKLSERQLQLIEYQGADWLMHHGYDLSGHAQLELGDAEIQRLEQADHKGLRRWRIERYGLGLVLKFKIASTLGMKRWRADLQRQFYEIESRYLK
jgi:hypothetical protein